MSKPIFFLLSIAGEFALHQPPQNHLLREPWIFMPAGSELANSTMR